MKTCCLVVPLVISVSLCASPLLGQENTPSNRAANSSTVSRLGYVWGPQDGEWAVMPPNEGSGILKASPRSGVQQLAMFAEEQPPWGGPPLHRHDDADEIFYVHSGAGIWTMEGRSWKVSAGATVFVPRGTWHTYSTTASSTEIIFVMSSPGLEEYLNAVWGVIGGPAAQGVTVDLARRYVTTACYQNGPVICSTRKPSVAGYILSRGEGETFAPDDSGRLTIIKASPETGSPSTVMFTQDIPAGAHFPARTNLEAEEILYIDEGTGTATLSTFRFPLVPGSVIFAPPGVAHGIENPSEAIRVVGFAGRPGLEGVLRNALTRTGPSTGGLTPEQIQGIRRKHESARN